MIKQAHYCSITFIMLIVFCCDSYSQSAKMIDVGGYKLEVQVAGSGSPTVVFEAGMGDDYSSWSTIMPFITQFTSAVAYSRAGNGKSEESVFPRSYKQIVSELRTLLDSLDGVNPPFVLVGHSVGSIIVRYYASTFKNEVSGLVIVDGSHEQQYSRFKAVDPKFWEEMMAGRSKFYADQSPSIQSEGESFLQLQLGKKVLPFQLPDIPIVVLTSTSLSGWIWTAEIKKVWRRMHSEWFESSLNGMHIVTNNSGHYIHKSEPELVVDAIKYVVNYVRTDTTKSKR